MLIFAPQCSRCIDASEVYMLDSLRAGRNRTWYQGLQLYPLGWQTPQGLRCSHVSDAISERELR